MVLASREPASNSMIRSFVSIPNRFSFMMGLSLIQLLREPKVQLLILVLSERKWKINHARPGFFAVSFENTAQFAQSEQRFLLAPPLSNERSTALFVTETCYNVVLLRWNVVATRCSAQTAAYDVRRRHPESRCICQWNMLYWPCGYHWGASLLGKQKR